MHKLTQQQHKNWQTWIEALRSGKYKQTTGGLYRPSKFNGKSKKPSYCCLGVACKVIPPVNIEDFNKFWKEMGTWELEYSEQYFGVRFSYIKDEKGSPIDWNDLFNLKFPEIADRLEKWYKENCK